MTPFDYVNAINMSKKDLMTGSEDDVQAERDYVPFVVNRSLSYFPETLLHVNLINQYPDLEKKLQFHFLLNSIRPGKRFSKWVKKEENADLELVMQHYSYSVDKAKQALPLLSNEQLSIIRTIQMSGVENDKHT